MKGEEAVKVEGKGIYSIAGSQLSSAHVYLLNERWYVTHPGLNAKRRSPHVVYAGQSVFVK